MSAAVRARLILACLAGLILYGIAAPAPPPARSAAQAGQSDVALYRAVVEAVRAGGDYHAVTAAALRGGEYPLRPFVTFRPPTLALTIAAVGDRAAAALMIALVGGAMLLWFLRVRAEQRIAAIGAGAAMLLAGAALFSADMLWWHEAWAGALVALAIGLRRPGKWRAAVLAGLAASLVREFAIPLLAIMAALAWHERERREAVAWLAALAVATAALGWHALAVAAVVTPADPVSPGWSGHGGWPLLLAMIRSGTPLALLPAWLTAIAVPLALAGWAQWRDPAARRMTIWLGFMALLIMIAARRDNLSWMLMLLPALPAGIALAPSALAGLVRRSTSR
jgi:hypothetical protein